jgi:hypothetical protein
VRRACFGFQRGGRAPAQQSPRSSHYVWRVDLLYCFVSVTVVLCLVFVLYCFPIF